LNVDRSAFAPVSVSAFSRSPIQAFLGSGIQSIKGLLGDSEMNFDDKQVIDLANQLVTLIKERRGFENELVNEEDSKFWAN